jgi:hypothetical protein
MRRASHPPRGECMYCTLPTLYRDARTVACRLEPSAAQAVAQTAVIYTHSTHSPKGPLACMVVSVRLTAPVSKLARRKTPSRWRFNAPKRSGAGAGQTRLVARQMHSTKTVCGGQAQRSGWARGRAAGLGRSARLRDDPERVGQVAQPSRRPLHRGIGNERRCARQAANGANPGVSATARVGGGARRARGGGVRGTPAPSTRVRRPSSARARHQLRAAERGRKTAPMASPSHQTAR